MPLRAIIDLLLKEFGTVKVVFDPSSVPEIVWTDKEPSRSSIVLAVGPSTIVYVLPDVLWAAALVLS